jgi:hypothetical protein
MTPNASGTLGRVQLLIRDDDEAGFERAREWLLHGFGRWLGETSRLSQEAADETVSDASLALDWKFGYGDGHLGRWTAGEITEFLVGWCPRKLSASQENCAAIPGNTTLLTDYLAARGLLAQESATAAVLRAAATDATAAFIAEMGNPARFGMAKALFAGAAARRRARPPLSARSTRVPGRSGHRTAGTAPDRPGCSPGSRSPHPGPSHSR